MVFNPALVVGCLVLLAAGSDARANCNLTLEHFTWRFRQESDTMIPGVVDHHQCQLKCLEQDWCYGWTWEKEDSTGTMCFLFNSPLEGLHPCGDCSHCISGKFKPIEGHCFEKSENILKVQNTVSEWECLETCYLNDKCNYYSWGNGTFNNLCFMYTECKVTSTCETFQSGEMECFTPYEPPSQCKDYNMMMDQTRSVNYGRGNNSDHQGSATTSPDWKGTGWYRMFNPAGTMMPEQPVGYDHCGGTKAGWLMGPHPALAGENVERKACFCVEDLSSDCSFEKTVNVTNCGDYYVYHLVDTSFDSGFRYCASQPAVSSDLLNGPAETTTIEPTTIEPTTIPKKSRKINPKMKRV